MSDEFSARSALTSLVRVGVLLGSVFVIVAGIVVYAALHTAVRWIGIVLVAIGLGGHAWGVIVSARDQSKLKWLNVIAKGFVLLLFLILSISILIGQA